MKCIYQHVEALLHQQPNQKFTLALSGGVDSVVLLHLLWRYRQTYPSTEINVVHVNHGLSVNADKWQLFCADLCQKWQFEFAFEPLVLGIKSRQSLEAVAREKRYDALEKHSPSDAILLLGQHLDDQAETFLIRLKRGSGLLGLGGMKAVDKLTSGKKTFRPLLNISRHEIESYAQQHGLSHIEDESNQDDKFDRNFLRNQVLPLLNDRFNGFSRTVARVSNLLQSQQSLLDEYLKADAQLCIRDNTFLLDEIKGFSEQRFNGLIRFWLSQNRLVLPSQKVLNQITAQAIQAKKDAQMNIQCQEYSIARYQNRLHICFAKKQMHDVLNIGLEEINQNNVKFFVNYEKGVRLPRASEQVNLRFSIGSEKFKLAGRNCTKSVNTWLKESHVAPWQRASFAGVYYNEQLVQVVGLGVAEEFVSNNGVLWHQEEVNAF